MTHSFHAGVDQLSPNFTRRASNQQSIIGQKSSPLAAFAPGATRLRFVLCPLSSPSHAVNPSEIGEGVENGEASMGVSAVDGVPSGVVNVDRVSDSRELS